MKALIITDLHRGINPNIAKIQEKEYSLLSHEPLDLIIVSGDWGTSNPKHVKGAFKFLRTLFPNIVICGVLGNHDLWDKKGSGIKGTIAKIENYAKDYNIHLLEKNALELDDYTILGFNGWYKDYNFNLMNDFHWINSKNYNDSCLFLKTKEKEAIQYIENYSSTKKKIIVSHFPVLEELVETDYSIDNDIGLSIINHCDFYIFGHTHDKIVKNYKNIIAINAGAEYGKVNYLIYDFETKTILKELNSEDISKPRIMRK